MLAAFYAELWAGLLTLLAQSTDAGLQMIRKMIAKALVVFCESSTTLDMAIGVLKASLAAGSMLCASFLAVFQETPPGDARAVFCWKTKARPFLSVPILFVRLFEGKDAFFRVPILF